MIKTSDILELLMMLSAICTILLDGKKQLIFMIAEIIIVIISVIVNKKELEKMINFDKAKEFYEL